VAAMLRVVPSQTKMPDTDRPQTTGANVLLVGIGIIAALYIARDVLIPITLAILLSFIVTPLVRVCRRLRTGRVLSVLIPVSLASLLVLGISGLLGNQLAQTDTECSAVYGCDPT
jgi:predicted PurR-regulated permease PerM